MKSSKLTPYDRRVRREKIMEKRGDMILAHKPRRVRTSKVYPRQSIRQAARYARQIAAGQLRLIPVVQAAPTKPKRIRKAASK